MTDTGHRPVMLAEIVAALNPRDGAIYVDGTFGGGGYADAILAAAECRLLGIDRDPGAISRGAAIAARHDGRLTMIEGRFGDMVGLLGALDIEAVDGIALDLGVSSYQLDDAGRGFSFRGDGPLDMRMGPGGPSAADVVNGYEAGALADIIHRYGEERRARRIAAAIVKARDDAPITRTGALADIVRRCYPADQRGDRAVIDPATRTFQALRIHVNDELGELSRGLIAAETLLGAGGHLAVVSFHSLEDRLVKDFLRARSGAEPRGSRHRPEMPGGPDATFDQVSRRPRRPGADEIAANPRARSARLRAGRRTGAPAWPADQTGGHA